MRKSLYAVYKRSVELTTIIVDTFEPPDIVEGLKHHLEVVSNRLVGTGFCDYLWYAADGHSVTVERKAVADLANNVDRLEIQLKNALQTADEVILLIEGVIEPVSNGSTVLYRQAHGKSMYVSDRLVNRPYSFFMGFLWRLDKLGVSHFYTANKQGTVEALAEFVKLNQQTDTKIFSRYIKTKPAIIQQNPQVRALIGLGIGESRAIVLIAMYKTIWNVLQQKPEDIAKIKGIGLTTANKIFELVGKK